MAFFNRTIKFKSYYVVCPVIDWNKILKILRLIDNLIYIYRRKYRKHTTKLLSMRQS